MGIRFYIDPETAQPHIYGHGVTEDEVRQVLARPGEDFRARKNSRIALGQTAAGRYLQVIYVPDRDSDDVLVITAYDLKGAPRKAYRRRKRRKGK